MAAVHMPSETEPELEHSEPSVERGASAAGTEPPRKRKHDAASASGASARRLSRCNVSGAVAEKWGEVPLVLGVPTVTKVRR